HRAHQKRPKRQPEQRHRHETWTLACTLGSSARVAEEDVDDLSRHVERGENDSDQNQVIRHMRRRPMRCGMKNFLFGPAAGEEDRHTAERHHADRVRHESYWHETPQAAHFANILFAVASVNHGACTEEQEGFEKTVREQVHYPSSNTADPKRD